MTRDPDILAIIRQRRQQARCTRCGRSAGRSTVCAACRAAHWRYCPRCETVTLRTRLSVRAAVRGSVLCPDCEATRRAARNRRSHQPRENWLQTVKQQEHPRLREAIAHYRAGLSLAQMAAAMDMRTGAVRALIHHARVTGRWPRGLKRGRNYERRPA